MSIFNNADGYEQYVGRWSRLVGRPFVRWLAVEAGGAWLDVGAGTGVLTQVILDEAAPSRIVGVDSSAEYTARARQDVRDARVEFRLGDAAEMALHEPPFDASVAGLVLNFTPKPLLVVQQMARAVKPGGLVAAYVWDYGGKMEMMRRFWETAVAIDPDAASLDSGARFTICRPENLRALFEEAGLTAVDVVPLDIDTRFANFEDYWQPIASAQGSLSAYLRGLGDERRAALRDALRERLPIREDGSFTLQARAWAVKGRTARGGE